MTRYLNYRIPRVLYIAILLSGLLFMPCGAIELGSTGSSGTPTISNGDPVTLHGIATGHPREGLQIWVIGKNYLKLSTTSVNSDNTFEYELRSSDTQNLASGQYYVVVQHPMMNGQFDIYYDSATGRVINRQKGNSLGIFQMTGAGSLQGPDSAQALVNAISSQDVDDSFTTYTFTIAPPSVFIDTIGDHAVGDKFTISGSTNLAVGDNLLVDITSSSFRPTSKNAPGGFAGANGMVTVLPGTRGYNLWSFDVDTSSFTPDEYIVKVSGVTIDVTGSTTFNVVERLPVTVSAPPVITSLTTQPASTTAAQTTPPVAATTVKSPMFFALGAAACIGVYLIKKLRN